jgi:hypothetical protein
VKPFFAVVTLLLSASQLAAADSGQVAVFKDRFALPQTLSSETSNSVRMEDVRSIWTWSKDSPPRSHDPNGGHPITGGVTKWLSVQIHKSVAAPVGSHVTLIAAPSLMWEEVPESVLPSYPIEISAKPVTVRLPFDAINMWRVRLVGSNCGTWWVDVGPGQRSVDLTASVAADRSWRVEGEEGGAVARARLSLLNESAGREELQKLADYRSDPKGRLTVQALPDAGRLTVFLGAEQRAPFVLEEQPSRIPERLVLRHGATVHGRVVNRSGRVVAGAVVKVHTWASTLVPLPLIRSVSTDKDGRFEIGALTMAKQMRGECQIAASGFADLSHDLMLDKETIDLGTLVLEPAVSIDVLVIDDRNEPVPATSLKIGSHIEATTDRKGHASLKLGEGANVKVLAMAAHHLTREATVSASGRGPAKIALQRSFRVLGHLTEGRGLASASSGHIKARSNSRFQNFTISPNGNFDIDLDPVTEYQLEISTPRSAVAKLDVHKGQPGEVRDLGEIVAPVSLTVTGQLVRESDGSPVAAAHIWLPRPSPEGPLMAFALHDVLRTTSDADGMFELAGVPDVPFMLRIEAPGGAPLRRAVTPEPDQHEIALGTIQLRTGAKVTISLDGEGGDDIQARIDVGGQSLPIDQLKSQFVDGRAVLANVPSGKVQVTAWRGREMLCREDVTVPMDQSDIDVVCTERKVAVSGRVMVGGKPAGVGGMLVWMTPIAPDLVTGVFTYGSGPAIQQQMFAPQGQRETTEVAADGSFHGALFAGAWEVLWMPEEGTAVGPRLITIPEVTAHEVQLEYAGLAVEGIVLDRDRKSVRGASVNDVTRRGMALSRDDGTFTLSGPDAGAWQIQARYRDETSAVITRNVQEGHDTPPVELVLSAAEETVQVSVASAGRRAPGAVVFLESDGGSLDVATTDMNGAATFRLNAPLPSRVRVAATAEGRWVLSDWTPETDAAKAPVDLSVGVTGSVVLHNKSQTSPVTITRADGWRVDRLLQWIGAFPRVSPESDLAIGGLPPGAYVVALGSQSRTASVEENKSVEMTFDP